MFAMFNEVAHQVRAAVLYHLKLLLLQGKTFTCAVHCGHMCAACAAIDLPLWVYRWPWTSCQTTVRLPARCLCASPICPSRTASATSGAAAAGTAEPATCNRAPCKQCLHCYVRRSSSCRNAPCRQYHLNALVRLTGVVTRRTGVFPQLQRVSTPCTRAKCARNQYWCVHATDHTP